MSEIEHPRSIRSFVTRAGRITPAQQRALAGAVAEIRGRVLPPRRWTRRRSLGACAPLRAEIGFGNGDNLLRLAAAHPQCDFLGIEVHRAGVGRLLLALETAALRNVRIICHDAVEVLEQQLAPASLDEILILFPDPWPKKRHHKRRLIQPPFVALAAARLVPGGRLRLATDWRSLRLRDARNAQRRRQS